MTYGNHDALSDVLNDLWADDDLVGLLESSDAISAGWPSDEQSHGVAVRVQPVTETSASMGAATERTFRLQVSVVATEGWRSRQPQPTYRMAEIMSTVADRLDVSSDIPGADPGEVASGSWAEVSGDRVALIQDWYVRVRPVRNAE